MINTLTSHQLKSMIIGAASVLENNKEVLDSLNVFPVPDGDTGTNMSLTMIAAAKEVASVEEDDLTKVAKALSLGALKGARGNSGVILSQIFSGFSDALCKRDGEFNTKLIADAMQRGVKYAYKAVMKPKEGTILTVARIMADAATAYAGKNTDVYEQIVHMISEGEKILKQTPEMLPVLKEAGVVDAGGAGFIAIVMGFKAVLDGKEVIKKDYFDVKEELNNFKNTEKNTDIQFAYCTEFFIKNLYDYILERDIDTFRNDLAKLGDCVLVVGDIDLVKVHVHTNEPGSVLQKAQALGELSKIKIDNMKEQHRELAEEILPTGKKSVGVVAVVSGDGIMQILKDWQVDCFVEGGQSLNPSTQDILQAIEKVPSDNVIVLPNNKNIILAADQAGMLSKKNVCVVHSNSMTEGIAAGVAYDPDADIDANKSAMEKAIFHVTTGQITKAVRDTKYNGSNIKDGEYIGICKDNIVANNTDILEVAKDLLKYMITEEKEIVSIYYGKDVLEEDAQKVFKIVEQNYKNVDCELLYGGQFVYDYYISAE